MMKRLLANYEFDVDSIQPNVIHDYSIQLVETLQNELQSLPRCLNTESVFRQIEVADPRDAYEACINIGRKIAGLAFRTDKYMNQAIQTVQTNADKDLALIYAKEEFFASLNDVLNRNDYINDSELDVYSIESSETVEAFESATKELVMLFRKFADIFENSANQLGRPIEHY